MAATANQRLPKRRRKRNPSADSSMKQSDSSLERASDVRAAVEILRKVKYKVVGDEFDDESQRKSHEGRLDDHEERLRQAEFNQTERFKVVAQLQRWRMEVEVWKKDLERRMRKTEKALETPPVQQASWAVLLSKRALQIIAALATGLAIFIGTLILTIKGGAP